MFIFVHKSIKSAIVSKKDLNLRTGVVYLEYKLQNFRSGRWQLPARC